MEKLTFQEEEAMRFIWKLGPCFVKDVVGCYDEPLPPYTTVASIITNLKKKRLSESRKIWKHLQIYPTGETGRLYQKFGKQSSEKLLCQLIQGNGFFLRQGTEDFER